MSDWQKASDNESELYGAEYYRTGLGPMPYDRSEPHWGEFFGKIADDLIRVFRPRTVFDAGCAKGFLVEALWDRGVETRGRDISSYAISQVRPDVAAYCEARSLSEPIDGRYDLVVNIEVLEHMAGAEASKAIANMAAVADRIVFSSSPDDFNEKTHINIKPTIYWLKQFRDHGFAPVVDLTLSTITAYALAYERRTMLPSDEELTAVAEIVRLRMQASKHTSKIGLLSSNFTDAQQSVHRQSAELQALRVQLDVNERERQHALQTVQDVELARQQVAQTHDQLTQELIEAQAQVTQARSQALASEDRVKHLEVTAAWLSARHASTLAHVNAKIAGLIHSGLASALQIEDLAKRAGRVEIDHSHSLALVALHKHYLVTFSAKHAEALSTIEVMSKALNETSQTLHKGKAAYDAAIERLQIVDEHLALSEHESASLRSSTSWRVTYPLRKLRGSADQGSQMGRPKSLLDVPPFPALPSSAPARDDVPTDSDAAVDPDLETTLFDGEWYLAHQADVAAQGADPLQHFLMHGQTEGRPGNRVPEVDPMQAVITDAERDRATTEDRVWAAADFDRDWYVDHHKDLGSEPDPVAHYLLFGLREGRPGNRADVDAGATRDDDQPALFEAPVESSALFATKGIRLTPELDREWYTANNKDVRESGGDPELHYVMFGKAEGRAPNAAVAEQRRIFRLQDFCNPYELEVFTPEVDPDFLVSILTPTYNTLPRYLRELHRSIANQRYGHWEWIVVDDGSTSPATLAALRDIARLDERVRLIVAERNTGISGASNAALQAARGTHCALVDHDDLLSRDALIHVHREWQAHKDAQLFYTDECKLLADGSLDQFWAKPSWSPAYLENTMCIGHLSVYEAGFLRDLGGFRSDYDGTQDYDLALRASLRRPTVRHVPVFAYLWRIIPGSSAADLSEKPYAVDRQRRAVLDYARHICPDAMVSPGWGAGYWRIRYPLSTPAPLLSYIIPTGAGRRVVRGESLDLITNCIRSFETKSFFPNREYIVVHNGDLSDDHLAALHQIPRVKLVHYDAPSFNFSEKLNLGAAHSSGEYLCLVNDDVEAITPYGGEEMVSYLAFNPQVGCIGPLCLRENDRIQQNGVMFLPGLGPVHAGDGQARNFGGPQNRLNCRRESVVIGGAMMIVRKSVFDDHGGYDISLPLNYNDVDFGMRLAQSGLTSVVDPGVEVYHFESSTRVGTTNVEQEVLFARGRSLDDPYFSRWFDPSSPNMLLRLQPWQRGVVHFGSWLDHEIAGRSKGRKPEGCFKFSVCVSVYNQSQALLRDMYVSFKMQTYANRELVLFDNGSSNPETAAWLAEVAAEGLATFGRTDENLGIMGANREMMKLAKGDFIVAMDADDFMAADALQVIANAAEQHVDAKIFYTDEYKSDLTSRRFSPFFKPDFDPVLLMNCCYPAHLMAMNVAFLKEIRAYEDDRATWSHDWDTLTRALAIGEEPVHVRALTYAWRINPGSTASVETDAKPGTVVSQKFVLDRFLSQRGLAPKLRVESNNIETSSGMWRLVTDEPIDHVVILDAASVWGKDGSGLDGLRSAIAPTDVEWVAVLVDIYDLKGLLALSAVARLDTRVRVVSGLVIDEKTNTLKWSGGLFTPGGIVIDPYFGHPLADGGYHGQLWCQRCIDVSAPINVLIRATSLRDALQGLSADATVDDLMITLGLMAHQADEFIAVTPHLQWVDTQTDLCPLPVDRRGCLLGDCTLLSGGRWYNSALSVDEPYTLASK